MDFDASSEPADGWPITDQGFSPDGTSDVAAALDTAQWTSPPQSLRLTVSPGDATYIAFLRQTDAALDEVDWVELSLDFRVDAPLQAAVAALTQQTERSTVLQLGGDSLSVGVYDANTGEGGQIALPTPLALQTWMHASIRIDADGTVSAHIDDAAPVEQSFDPAPAVLKVGTYLGFGSSLEDQSGSVQFDNVVLRAGKGGEGE
jgi:hypothetical protein